MSLRVGEEMHRRHRLRRTVVEDGHVAKTVAFFCLSARHTPLPASVPGTLPEAPQPCKPWTVACGQQHRRQNFHSGLLEALPTRRRCQSTAHSHQAPGGGLWSSVPAASDVCMVSASSGEPEALHFPPTLAALREVGPGSLHRPEHLARKPPSGLQPVQALAPGLQVQF